MNRKGRSFISDKRGTIRFCCYIIVLVLILISLTLTYHHYTCQIWVSLCTDWFLNLPLLISSMDKMPVEGKIVTKNVATNLLCDGSMNNTKRANSGVSWVILLASQKTGSTWLQQTLDSHEKITLGNERLLDYMRNCKASKESCKWPQIQQKIEDIMYSYEKKHTKSSVVGFNIQYDQIIADQREDFARWVYCKNVVVIHLIRSASILSFWTLQAQVYDTIQLGQYVDATFNSKLANRLKTNTFGLVLNVQDAVLYVKRIESIRSHFRILLRFHPVGVRYVEVFYEDLLLDNGDERPYLTSLVSFLGVENGQKLLSSTKRLHPGSCSQKIKNWEDIRKALKGTEAEYACRR